jgi:hypothetical protein
MKIKEVAFADERLIYSITGDEISIVSIILEWFDHKDYERRFSY